MAPTIAPEERIQVDLSAYRTSTPQRWDIIVFNPPKYSVDAPTDDLGVWVFRVVGIPGDTISLDNGTIFVNGEQASPPATESKILYRMMDFTDRAEPPRKAIYPLNVPAGKFFVCGDNASSANDSRSWGLLPESAIIGKVINKK